MSESPRLIDQILMSPPLTYLMDIINDALKQMGVVDDFVTGKHVVVTLLVGVLTMAMYFLLFGLKHRRSRRKLELELREAWSKVHELEIQVGRPSNISTISNIHCFQLEEKGSDSEDEEKKEVGFFDKKEGEFW